MPGTKIICIGSPFGDDQFGAWVYEQLRSLIDPSAAELLYLDRPGTRLIAELEEVVNLILIDAVKSGAAIGSVLHIEGEAIYRQLARHTSTHGFGVADALQLAERLGQVPAKVVLLGVEAGETDTLAPLSSQMRASLPMLLEALNNYAPQRTCRLG
jgi:hydrogenase maturation protease